MSLQLKEIILTDVEANFQKIGHYNSKHLVDVRHPRQLQLQVMLFLIKDGK